jgi:hypothetical protein
VGRRGRKRQLDLESEYWKLLQSGVGTVAACRLLGIGRKTGYRWRAENGGLPPARLAESARSGRYLTLLERQRIALLRPLGIVRPPDRDEVSANFGICSRTFLQPSRASGPGAGKLAAGWTTERRWAR